MNGNYLYNSYSDNSFSPADDSNGSGDSNGGPLNQTRRTSMNSMRADADKTSNSIMANQSSNSHGSATQRRQTLPMDFSGCSTQINNNTMRRVSAVDFATDGAGALNPFSFDASMAGVGTMDPALTGDLQQMNLDFQDSSNKQDQNLSVDTQFANSMGFNTLGQNQNFTSPLDMNVSPYIGSAGGMGTGLDLGMEMEIMGDSISGMNDFFNTQQFGSPIMTSPMTSTFPQNLYGSVQNTSAGSMDTTGQMLNDTAMNNSFQIPSTTTAQALNNILSQANSMTSAVQSKASMPPPSSTSSAESRKQQTNTLATIGNLTLPWSNPTGGWPSTMPGAKAHMDTQYRDAYAPSGFDLMKTLFRVVSRPNPQINLGAVDLSCAFVVCDARSHDNPIIYCSESFERLTGYTRYEIKGQNCRFLQSPDGVVEAGIKRKYCDDESVLYLKNCITNRAEAQISLINYRKGGQPFMNLLTMIPIYDDDGEVFQFVGFQVDLVENPHAVNARNSDGTYSVNYQRNESLPPYLLPAQEQSVMSDPPGLVTRDEVSTVLHTLASSGINELSARMLEKIVLENSDDVIHVLSLKGLFLYLSPSCRRILEYNPTELVGAALSSVCHPSDIVPVTRELKEAQSGNSVTVVFRIRRKSSGYVWFESHGSLHTEQGKGRKCIILVGRERPVYTLSKHIILTGGGLTDHDMWCKMSTTGMLLYVSGVAKTLLDRQPDELVGTNIQALMRPDSKKEFDRVLTIALTGQAVQVRHDMLNRRGQVNQAHTWLYPGDAIEGQKPTFLISQTKILKYSGRGKVSKLETQSTFGSTTSFPISSGPASTGGATPRSAFEWNDSTFTTTEGVTVSKAGQNAIPIGNQDLTLASLENAFEELKTTRSSSWQYELRQLEKRNRLLAEEVQSLLAAKKKRKRRRGAGLLQKDCANCHTTNTPEWRRGPSGNRDLCNSCGLRWAKQQGRVSPRTTSPKHTPSNGSSKASKTSPSPLNHSTTAATRASEGNTSSSTSVPTPNTAEPVQQRHGLHEKRASAGDPNPDPSTFKVARADSSTSESSSIIPNPPSSVESMSKTGQRIGRIDEVDESP